MAGADQGADLARQARDLPPAQADALVGGEDAGAELEHDALGTFGHGPRSVPGELRATSRNPNGLLLFAGAKGAMTRFRVTHLGMTRPSLVSTGCVPSPISNINIKPLPDMNTFTDLPASTQAPLNGGEYVTNGMARRQQSFAGVTTLAA